jgi:hypothetical protein
LGTPVCKFYDYEIEQVIAGYLIRRDIAAKTPTDIANEIVKLGAVRRA